ncbi:PTS sugar transporter subunit IIA [Luxibacter massiliensis]|uniref:PTS sugar transporter subunit IIA n=1 Tax=Luxibacter massiliensis TaxID=2219695 RepID=UPI000F066C33|nr:PTS sugar transporter subunit IIA [Luxibacter massiliensis]
MIGIVVVTHGDFGKELLKSTEMIMGDIEKIKALSLYSGDSLDTLREQVTNEIQSIDEGDGVLVLVDLFGGSPCNAAAVNVREDNVECVAGLSMPMLIKAVEARMSMPLKELPKECMEYVQESAVNVKACYTS